MQEWTYNDDHELDNHVWLYYSTYSRILEDGRNEYQMSRHETSLFEKVARSNSRVAASAQSMLLKVFGEEWALPQFAASTSELNQNLQRMNFEESEQPFLKVIQRNAATLNHPISIIVFVPLRAKDARVRVRATWGKELFSQTPSIGNENMVKLPGDRFGQGVYFVQLIVEQAVVDTKKLLFLNP